MAELLIFAKDYSIDPAIKPEQLAALPKLYDVIAWRPDGWLWGTEELKNPLFRVVKIQNARPSDLDAFVTPLAPVLDKDMIPITLGQYRASYFDITNPAVPADVKSWFVDVRRDEETKQAVIGVNDVVTIKTPRPEIPIDLKP